MVRFAQGAAIAVSFALAGCAQSKTQQFCKGDFTARYEDSRSWVEYRNADPVLSSGPLRPVGEDDGQNLINPVSVFTDDGFFYVVDTGLIVPRDIASRRRWGKDQFACEREGVANSFDVTCRSKPGAITTTYNFRPNVGITSFKINCSGCANRYAKLVTKQGMGALCSSDTLQSRST